MKNWLIMVSLLVLVGCATAPPAIYLNNETMPGRVYNLESTMAPIKTTTLFYALKPVKDIDGSTTSTMEYLQINRSLEIVRSEVEGVFLRISVTNPTKMAYSVNCFSQLTFSDGRASGKNETIARSALDARIFTIALPMPPKLHKASFLVTLTDDKGQELLRIGDLRFSVTSPIVVR